MTKSLSYWVNRVLEVLYEFCMRFQTRSAPDWTRTSTSFQTTDFKSATYTISITRAWLSGQGSNLRCVSQSHMCYHYTTRQFLLGTPGRTRTDTLFQQQILNLSCLPLPSQRYGCPEMTRTSILWARTTRATFAPQDNFRYSQRESNPYFNFEKVTT